MYKERTGGHNRSSTKEKRNTYPPLKYSPTLRSRGMGDFYVKYVFHRCQARE